MHHHCLLRILLGLALLFAGMTNAMSYQGCQSVYQGAGVGPWDYTDPQPRSNKRQIPIVEAHHFGRDIEYLNHNSIRILGSNIDYMLRASPNHHRALRSMTRLVQRANTSQPDGMRYTLECWFSRAQEIQPADGMVPMIYGMYYFDIGQYRKALSKMQEGLELEPGNRTIQYNIALVYFELGLYDEARINAEKAYAQGFPLEGLRSKLKARGQW